MCWRKAAALSTAPAGRSWPAWNDVCGVSSEETTSSPAEPADPPWTAEEDAAGICFSVSLGFKLPSDYIHLDIAASQPPPTVLTSELLSFNTRGFDPHPCLSSEEDVFSSEPPLTFPGK